MKTYRVSAHYIKKALNLAILSQADLGMELHRKERYLLVYRLGETQYVCAYPFGVVVVFGIDDQEKVDGIIVKMRRIAGGDPIPGNGDEELVPEVYDVIIDPEQNEVVEFDFIRFKQLLLDDLLLVFHVVAQSVAIDFLESRVDRSIDRFEKIHHNLAHKGSLKMDTKEVLKMIGSVGLNFNFVVDKLSLLDKPDVAWEEKRAELLYSNLRKMFELDDRFSSLRFKMEFVQDSSELVLDILENRKSAMLEIIIILLIAFEVVFFLVVGA